jgi:hypothetical protein
LLAFQALPSKPARYAKAYATWLPVAGLIWTDELPQGVGLGLKPPCFRRHPACEQTLKLLLACRAEAQLFGEPSPDRLAFWRRANELIPGWVGFRRLSISATERAAILTCERNAQTWMEALSDVACERTGDPDALEITEHPGGVIHYTAAIKRREPA